MSVPGRLEQTFRVTFPGPFSQHAVVVDGWKVPLLHAHLAEDDKVMLVIDDRLAETFTTNEAERVVPFLAHAIAVALGYTCHPDEDHEGPLVKQPQPHPMRTHGIVAASDEA